MPRMTHDEFSQRLPIPYIPGFPVQSGFLFFPQFRHAPAWKNAFPR